MQGKLFQNANLAQTCHDTNKQRGNKFKTEIRPKPGMAQINIGETS